MNASNSELEQIKSRYEKRKTDSDVIAHSGNFYFNHYAQAERELEYLRILYKYFSDFDNLKLLEIGAGGGGNLYFFQKNGFSNSNIFANELLPDRLEILKHKFSGIHILSGDATQLDESEMPLFDIVFQSTVFTSILDSAFKMKLAGKMWSLTKPGGMVLWYDFAFDNPSNKDVKGIKKMEIRKLFPEAQKINFHKVTLAPPIGRKVKNLYPFFNLFPFLRTHLIAEIIK